MFYLIYSSYATQPLNDEDLKELLDKARRRNIFKSVTGILFYFEGKFIQLIEGEENTIKLLYAAIYNDPRHQKLQLHQEDAINERYFPDWTMAFKPISSEDVEGALGFRNMSVPNATNVESVMKLYKILGSKSDL
ncbi:BLUF domain-containing protein [Mucilaginibacter gilvus]|uniref:BLUF domain-containing protein n=1 Tax=Mucilaginibacter gilvus TaxID=2305909 RepID=A0A444MM48_9SPHI|nr:BLUF domain-containing protein [Mucilaginibacter gilvus]RWY50354.1 BLUF domain-containing protein [Mucilaginibacter gilvus]